MAKIKDKQLEGIKIRLRRETQLSVAKSLGVPYQCLQVFLGKHGTSASEVRSDFRRVYIKENRTLSLEQLAKDLECCQGTVRTLLRNARP